MFKVSTVTGFEFLKKFLKKDAYLRKYNIIFLCIAVFGIFYYANRAQFAGSAVHITMYEKGKQKLNPQLYFAEKGEGLSESNSRFAFKQKNNTYYFRIPNIKNLAILRFDPDKNPGKTIVIKKISIVSYSFLYIYHYSVDLTFLKPIDQVKIFKKNNHLLTFLTTGNDSRFYMQFPFKLLDTKLNFHIYFLLTYLIAICIIFYLWKLSNDFTLLGKMWQAKIILYAVFFAFVLFKLSYYHSHIKTGHPPDELAHLAYIDFVAKNKSFIPKFENMFMVHNKKEGNYLSHPPLYYQLLAYFYSPSSNFKENIMYLRSISSLIYIFSILLIFYIGLNMKNSILGDFVFLTLVTSIPMHAYIGASLSNDILALLSASLFAIALRNILDQNFKPNTIILLFLGIFLAFFSKLTVFLLVIFALFYFILSEFLIKKQKIIITKKQWFFIGASAIVVLIPIIYYQSFIYLKYHGIRPSFKLTHTKEFYQSHFYVPPEVRQHLTAYQWYLRMKQILKEGWFGIQSHHSLMKYNLKSYLGLFVLHIFALIAFFSPQKKYKKNIYYLLGKYTLLSILSVLFVHYIFTYNNHLKNGYMGGLQARYYLPFAFSFAILGSIFADRFHKCFWWTVLVSIICLHAIYSDFCYFLLYYH